MVGGAQEKGQVVQENVPSMLEGEAQEQRAEARQVFSVQRLESEKHLRLWLADQGSWHWAWAGRRWVQMNMTLASPLHVCCVSAVRPCCGRH